MVDRALIEALMKRSSSVRPVEAGDGPSMYAPGSGMAPAGLQDAVNSKAQVIAQALLGAQGQAGNGGAAPPAIAMFQGPTGQLSAGGMAGQPQGAMGEAQLAQAAIPLPRPRPEPPQPTTYTIRKGDNLIAIAKAFGTTVAELQKLNGIKNANKIYVGHKLKLPGAANAS
jgi:2',3'-cyclic-nucleotide 2'-phosphodiesterase/3'-nucleotidase